MVLLSVFSQAVLHGKCWVSLAVTVPACSALWAYRFWSQSTGVLVSYTLPPFSHLQGGTKVRLCGSQAPPEWSLKPVEDEIKLAQQGRAIRDGAGTEKGEGIIYDRYSCSWEFQMGNQCQGLEEQRWPLRILALSHGREVARAILLCTLSTLPGKHFRVKWRERIFETLSISIKETKHCLQGLFKLDGT